LESLTRRPHLERAARQDGKRGVGRVEGRAHGRRLRWPHGCGVRRRETRGVHRVDDGGGFRSRGWRDLRLGDAQHGRGCDGGHRRRTPGADVDTRVSGVPKDRRAAGARGAVHERPGAAAGDRGGATGETGGQGMERGVRSPEVHVRRHDSLSVPEPERAGGAGRGEERGRRRGHRVPQSRAADTTDEARAGSRQG